MQRVFLEIREPNGQPFQIVTDIIALEAAVKFNELGALNVTLPDLYNPRLFRRDMQMRVFSEYAGQAPIQFADATFLLEKVTRRDKTLILSGPDMMAVLQRAIVAYTGETLYADKTNEEADISGAYYNYFFIDDLMREFVRENLSVDALDPLRNNPFLSSERNRSLAPIGQKSASFQNLLSTLQELAKQSEDKGTPLFFSVFRNGEDSYMFRVWSEQPRVDRSSTSDLPLVLLEENGDIDDVEETIDWTEEGNVVYGLGGGSGSSRVYAWRTNTGSLRSGPFSRREYTHDMPDVDNIDSGNSAWVDGELGASLQGKRARIRISARINDGSDYVYGRDYAFGDKVVAVTGFDFYRQYDCYISAARMSMNEGKVKTDVILTQVEFLDGTTTFPTTQLPGGVPFPEPDPPLEPPPTDPGAEPVPGAPPDIPPLPLYDGQNVVAIIDEYGQIFRTSNFQDASPTWDRKTISGLGGSEKVLSFVADPFSPLYRGTGSTVNGFVATEHYIYKISDMFGTTPTKTLLYDFGYVTNPDLDRNRVIQASFGRFFPDEADNPWLICISHNGTLSGHEGTGAVYSIDGGATWSAGSLTPHSDPETGEFREPHIGLYLSPKTPGLAYAAAYLSTAPEADGYVSEDWGATWTAISNPNIDPEDGLAGDIHSPWLAEEDYVYHGVWTKGDPLQYGVRRVEGTGATDISPSHGGKTFGVNRSHFAIRTYDSDSKYVALAGIANGTTASFDDDVFAAFVSNDHGATWTNIVNTLAKTDPHPEHIAFSGDNPDILFLFGSERYIAYSSDFGATVSDKSGNMPGSFPTDIRDLVGIVGGSASP